MYYWCDIIIPPLILFFFFGQIDPFDYFDVELLGDFPQGLLVDADLQLSPAGGSDKLVGLDSYAGSLKALGFSDR